MRQRVSGAGHRRAELRGAGRRWGNIPLGQNVVGQSWLVGQDIVGQKVLGQEVGNRKKTLF